MTARLGTPIALLLLVGLGGVAYLMHSAGSITAKTVPSVATTSIATQTKAASTPSTTRSATTTISYRMYTDTTRGMRFEIPSNWIVKTENSELIIASPDFALENRTVTDMGDDLGVIQGSRFTIDVPKALDPSIQDPEKFLAFRDTRDCTNCRSQQRITVDDIPALMYDLVAYAGVNKDKIETVDTIFVHAGMEQDIYYEFSEDTVLNREIVQHFMDTFAYYK